MTGKPMTEATAVVDIVSAQTSPVGDGSLPVPSLKAWYVEDSSRECAEIVYATTRHQARHKGAGRLDAEYMDVTATRRPVYDPLAPSGPSEERLFNDGWWFDCCCCAARCDNNNGGAIIAARFYCEDHLPDGVGWAPRPTGSEAQAEHRDEPIPPHQGAPDAQ